MHMQKGLERRLERRRQTELLIVHVATLGGRHLPVRRRRRGRLLGLATVEHDSSEDPTQSGRVDRTAVMQRVVFGLNAAMQREEDGRRRRERRIGLAGADSQQAPVYKIAGLGSQRMQVPGPGCA